MEWNTNFDEIVVGIPINANDLTMYCDCFHAVNFNSLFVAFSFTKQFEKILEIQ